ncbi:MAG: uroporphyrinogen decarboxylase family protein [Firmicutes bacterium]|nr:uroporphyrinogen decarboxylase family protein [Bacillota bacterium]
MSNHQQLLIKAMTWDHPEEIPISVGCLPAMWLHYGDEMTRFAREYPDFLPQNRTPESVKKELSGRYKRGQWTDEWGCVWNNAHEGMDAIATGHPVPRREDVLSLEIPENRDGSLPHGLMYLRLLDLRGFEEAMLDFAEECGELQILIDKVLEYNCIQIECALPKTGEVMYFGDDLGMQKGLAIGALKWRKYMKPCFARMFGLARRAGKLVYLHTDGCIWEIMPDLQECGAAMLNPQIRANGLENLVRVCKGKIPINLDLDRQMYPFAAPSQLRGHVRECAEALWLPQGGLGLSVELNYEVPLENAAAILDELRAIKTYRG